MATVTTPIPDVAARRPRTELPTTAIVVAAVIALAYLPQLWAHFGELWVKPQSQFFPFVFVGSAILAWRQLAKVTFYRPGIAGTAWSILGSAWALLAVAEVFNSSTIGALSFLLLVLAAIYAIGGGVLVRTLLPAWAFLFLILPVPFRIALTLQRWSTQWCSLLLDLARIYHVAVGNMVKAGPDSFFVDEACAGINSLCSVLACALFYVLLFRLSVIRSVLLLLSAAGWVLLANVMRIFLVVASAYKFNFDLAKGWRHEALGFVLFGAALFMIWSTDSLLALFSRPRIKPKETPAPQPAWAHPAEARPQVAKTCLGAPLAGAAFGAILLAHIFIYGVTDPMRASTAGLESLPDPSLLEEKTMPQLIGRWKREAFEKKDRESGSEYGDHSKIWTFRGDGLTATFSCDYPYINFHQVQICYQSLGCIVDERESAEHKSEPDIQGAPKYYATRKLVKPDLVNSYLFYCEFDQTGRVLETEAAPGPLAAISGRDSAWKRFRAWTDVGRTAEPPQVGNLFQFQMVVESKNPLSDEELETATKNFFVGFQTVHSKLFEK